MTAEADTVPMTREEMIEFLTGHYRYHTMNSWNNARSYARNVKVHSLPDLTSEQREKCYALLDCENVYDQINYPLHEFDRAHPGWTTGYNGRSSGYIVLYQTDGGRPPRVYPGRGTDGDTDFSDWENEDLEARVALVKDFDDAVDAVIAEFVATADAMQVVEDTVVRYERKRRFVYPEEEKVAKRTTTIVLRVDHDKDTDADTVDAELSRVLCFADLGAEVSFHDAEVIDTVERE